MKKISAGMTVLGFIIAAWLCAEVPVRAQDVAQKAQDVDQRIQSIEAEIARLKTEQAQTKSEQLEMQKQATEAAAALPTFTYRPGSGLLIEAADKSWSFRAGIETVLRLEYEAGKVQVGREKGGIFARKFRPNFWYCVNDCLYEIQAALDLDGWGTGNAKNTTGGVGSILQRGLLWVHMEKMNPWLPTLYLGMDGPSEISSYRQGSSITGSQLEYDLLSRNTFDDGRFGNGFGLNWVNQDLSPIGIPGRIPLLNIAYATIREGDDGLQSFKTPRNTLTYINVEPFSQIKNKWIQGLGFEFGGWFCPNTINVGTTPATNLSQACSRLQIQDLGDGGRQNLFQSGTYGHGLTYLLMPGFAWTVGPYRLRAVGGFQREATDRTPGLVNCQQSGTSFTAGTSQCGTAGHKRANMFLFGHDLFVWSPKGFLTGTTDTAGSILVGQHFERTDADCGASLCDASGQFSRNRILLREWDIWYFLMSRMSVGASWLWYDASNLRTGNGQAGDNLGVFSGVCRSTTGPTSPCTGKGGKWLDWIMSWRYFF